MCTTPHTPTFTSAACILAGALSLATGCASGVPMGDEGFEDTASGGSTGGSAETSMGGSPGGSPGGSSGGDAGSGPPAGVCGDGQVDPGEACDDGNVEDGDGCSSECTIPPPGCGDGMIQPGELCHEAGATFEVAQAEGVALGDLDGDGDLDLVASEPALIRVRRVLLEDGAAEDSATFLTGERPNLLTLQDMDADGALDLSVRTGPPNDRGWSMLPGNGAGMFGAVEKGIEGGLYAYAAGNLDLDGIPDMVFSMPKFLSSEDVVIAAQNYGLNVGDVTLLDGWEPMTPIPVLALADLDGDGRDDMVAASGTSPASYSILRTNSAAEFDPPTILGNFPTPVDLIVQDLDGDGTRDVLAALDGQTQILALYLDDQAAIDTIAYIPLAFEAQRLALGNFDGEGALDLAAVTPTGTLELLPHVGGDQVFGPGASLDVGEVPSQVAVGDLNGDGLDDLAVALPEADRVQLLVSRP